MVKLHAVVVLFLCAVSVVIGQTNMAAFFRISSPSNAVITAFNPVSGTISWSNAVTGSTNQLQRAYRLDGTNNWMDFVQLVSMETVTVSDRLIDLNPPEGMVLIPGGVNSGTNPLATGESYSDSYPATYSLDVSSFYMDQTEVTKAQWDTIYNWATNNNYQFDNAGSGKAPNHPVHTVNWYDCVKWCNARSEVEDKTPCYTVSGKTYKTGQNSRVQTASTDGYRLPTSTEWEYAARGGRSSRRFPWSDTITHSRANYYSSSWYSYDTSSTRDYHHSYDVGEFPYSSPVGSFTSNGYGVYDMSGNVWEWCWDESDPFRCLRGGSWHDGAGSVRCGWEDWDNPDGASNSDGFRTVCR